MYTMRNFLIPYKRNPYTEEEKKEIMRFFEEGSSLWGRGREILFFEKEMAEFCGTKYATLVESSVIHIVAAAIGLGLGDEVIVPPNTFVSVAQDIEYLGARPVFVDVEEDTFNLDPDKIEKKITNKTKIIWPVHSQGHPANMDPIMEIAEKHGIRVFENMAHAVGAKYKGKRVPVSEAATACLRVKSLWLPTSADVVVTDNKELAEGVKARRFHGFTGSGDDRAEVLALSFLPPDFSAAVGRSQLRHLQEYIDLQREHAKILTELLEGTPVITPVEKDYAYHTYLRYVIRAPKRDALRQFLANEGVETSVLYALPLHLQPYALKFNYGYKQGDFPVTEKQKKEELALPEPKFRSQWELEYIAKKIKEFYS